MKRFCMALCLLLLVPMAGLADSQTVDANYATREAEAVREQLLAGDYEGVVARLADSIKKLLTADQLKAGWEAQLGALGAYQSSGSTETQAKGDYFVAQIVLKHEKGEQLLSCTFDKDGKLASLTLTKPQTVAEKPLPAGVVEIPVTLFEGTDHALKGTVTKPEGDGPFMAAVFAAGSGASDQNETVGANAPFRDLARGLAQRGIASIRYEKPTYAHPEQFTGGATVATEYTLAVAEAQKMLLQTVKADRVYLVGHSLGAMLAPRLMRDVGGFAGGALLAGSPRKLWEIIYDQNEAVIAALPEDSRATYQKQVDEQLALAKKLDGMTEEERSTATIFSVPAAYLFDVCDGDAAEIAKTNALPLFIAQGSLDWQVNPERDFGAWKENLGGMGGLVEYHLYEGLSHLFIPSPEQGRGTVAEYNVEGELSAQLMDDLAAWMDKAGA